MIRSLWLMPFGVVLFCTPAAAQEIPALAGWNMLLTTAETHRACVDIAGPQSGKGTGKIVGKASDN